MTVPGCPSAWAELSRRFGKLPFAELLQPAISLARDGFPAVAGGCPSMAESLRRIQPSSRSGAGQAWFDTFLIDGRAPKAGELFRNPAQATTLEELAATECESLYRGALAQRLDAHARATGGYLRAKTWRVFVRNGSTRSASVIAATTSGRSRPAARAWSHS